MNCKKCGAVLEDQQTVCPCCGKDNKERPPKKPLSKKAKVIIISVSAVVAVLLSLVAVALCIIKPWQNDIFNKDKYQTEGFWEEQSRGWVVATMGDYKLTNGQLRVFYWMQIYETLDYYGDYASYYLGFDVEKPHNEQQCTIETDKTWEQYFIQEAINTWHRYQATAAKAIDSGYQLPVEYQEAFAGMKESMEETAKSTGYESADAMLQTEFGNGVTYDDYYYYLNVRYTAELYFTEITSQLVFTKAELEEYFQKNEEELAKDGITKDSGNLVDFRNILVKPVGTKDENGDTVYTQEAWDVCYNKAQTIWETWDIGERTEVSFAALAKLKSEDKTSSSNGGLYEYVAKNTWATVDVRHILVMPEGGTKNESGTSVTYSEEEWEACRVAAQLLLDEYLAGEQTEEAFGALANEHSEDQGGKVTNGGLYANVSLNEMVKPFEAWIFDSSRQPGETGLVKTEYGYHVMYFVKRNAPVDDWAFAEDRKPGDATMVKTDSGYQLLFYVGDDVAWEVYCEERLLVETTRNMIHSYADERPIEVRYWAITLSARTQQAAKG